MREKKYHIYLTAEEQSRVIQSLIRLKNELLEQGRYTDAVDDVLCKVLAAKKKRETDHMENLRDSLEATANKCVRVQKEKAERESR